MNDFGLGLAVIGNGRTAALLEPSSRLVWWCFALRRRSDILPAAGGRCGASWNGRSRRALVGRGERHSAAVDRGGLA